MDTSVGPLSWSMCRNHGQSKDIGVAHCSFLVFGPPPVAGVYTEAPWPGQRFGSVWCWGSCQFFGCARIWEAHLSVHFAMAGRKWAQPYDYPNHAPKCDSWAALA